MSLIEPLIDMKRYTPFEDAKYYWGRVIYNNDPRMLGRIKVQIHDLLPFTDYKQLPWMYPLYPTKSGRGANSGALFIPELDTYVIVQFQQGSPYFGFYIGEIVDRRRRANDLNSEYPTRYGETDSLGNKTFYIKTPGLCVKEHRSPDGSLSISSDKDSTFFFKDRHGTVVNIDRMNQNVDIRFGGCRVQLFNGTLKFSVPNFHLDVSNIFNALAKNTISLGSKVVAIAAQVFAPAATYQGNNDDQAHSNTLGTSGAGSNIEPPSTANMGKGG